MCPQFSFQFLLSQAKLKEFKRQYVDHAARKLRLIVDMTSANCSHQVRLSLQPIDILPMVRGRAEKEPRISIPVSAVPVSELLAGKNRKICKSLN